MVETATHDEESAGLENYRYQHMAQIAPESRLLAKQGLKLKVRVFALDKYFTVMLQQKYVVAV